MNPLVFRLLEKLSATALSQQLPLRLIEHFMPYLISLSWNAWLALAASVAVMQ
jgi:hypothetical protein